MLEINNLHKSFGGLRVAKGIDLRLQRGERRVLLGPNGAGKTTLFNLITGTLKPTCGAIFLDGSDISGLSIERRVRRGLSRSYQKNNLFDQLTVRENLSLAVAGATHRAWSLYRDTHQSADLIEFVQHIAAQVGLLEILDLAVNQADYGSRRQLEVGLALATRPKVLLMDEPTSGIGPDRIRAFHALLQSFSRDLTMLIIEHDMDLAFDIADRISVLNYGAVVFEGTPAQTQASSLVQEIYLGAWDGDAPA